MKTTSLSTRRRFFWKAGAALSAPLAVAGTAAAEAGAGSGDEAAWARLARLEDENAIRALNRAYAAHVNARAYDEAAALFADPVRAEIDRSMRGLSAEGLGSGDSIEVADGGTAATARFHCVALIETPLEDDCTLVQMARAQGEGTWKRSERRVLEAAYVKQGGAWKIERLASRSP